MIKYTKINEKKLKKVNINKKREFAQYLFGYRNILDEETSNGYKVRVPSRSSKYVLFPAQPYLYFQTKYGYGIRMTKDAICFVPDWALFTAVLDDGIETKVLYISEEYFKVRKSDVDNSQIDYVIETFDDFKKILDAIEIEVII